ncbi:hypothetical protein KBD45_03620 [Candidatus Dojkabacteria bacterium]|nr:hypothetical protein [Candidatus Dojkabacteria bacterium]
MSELSPESNSLWSVFTSSDKFPGIFQTRNFFIDEIVTRLNFERSFFITVARLAKCTGIFQEKSTLKLRIGPAKEDDCNHCELFNYCKRK